MERTTSLPYSDLLSVMLELTRTTLSRIIGLPKESATYQRVASIVYSF